MKDFNKVFKLIQKTGDKFIVEDQEGNLFAIMDLLEYEDLVLKNSEVKDLSEEELLNRINKDIAIWRSAKGEDEIIISPESEESKPEEDRYYFEPKEEEE